jgi:hypothetical protein
MTNQEFDAILENRITKIRETLKSKGKEYTHGDQLSNFNRAAEMQGISREKALIGMWSKHVVFILDIVDEMDNGIMPLPQVLDEKITDAVNYLCLLEAMIIEDLGRDKVRRAVPFDDADRSPYQDWQRFNRD